MSVSKEKLAQLDPETRLDYLMRYHEVKATQSEAFWNAISSFAAVAVPLLAFLGIERATRK